MDKRKLVVSYKNLTPELLALVKQKYPFGYQDYVIKVSKPNNDFFHAITLDTPEASYLIKVHVKIDTKPKDEDEEKGFFSDSDEVATDEEAYPEDQADQGHEMEDE